jgi:ATP-dependent DNA ligase
MVNYYQGCGGVIDPRNIDEFDFGKSDYLIEQKYDGIYIQLVFDDEGKLSLVSRNMKVKDNEQLESLRLYLEQNLNLKNSVINGELAFSTQAGTEYQKKYGHSKVDVFDILKFKNEELSTFPLLKRKEILHEICEKLNSEYIVEAKYIITKDSKIVKQWFDNIIANGGEGLVIKDLNDTNYVFGGKSNLWYKIKKLIDMDYVIMGYEDSKSEKYGKQGWVKNIICGLYVDGKLKQKVRVGSMTEEIRKEISENKNKYIGTVIEVHGFEIFKSGSIRHPSFSRFRDDKNSEDCVWRN